MVDSSQPMEIDPVDDGPKQPMAMNIEDSTPPPPLGAATAPAVTAAAAAAALPASTAGPEDARQAIEMLRGDDVAERVAAATRLESVANALGEERTREVS